MTVAHRKISLLLKPTLLERKEVGAVAHIRHWWGVTIWTLEKKSVARRSDLRTVCYESNPGVQKS